MKTYKASYRKLSATVEACTRREAVEAFRAMSLPFAVDENNVKEVRPISTVRSGSREDSVRLLIELGFNQTRAKFIGVGGLLLGPSKRSLDGEDVNQPMVFWQRKEPLSDEERRTIRALDGYIFEAV